MQEYQLLCGIAIAVWATLFAVLRQIYIPTTITPRSKVRTVKGKKGKAQRKPVALASQKSEPFDSAGPLPLQPPVLQAPLSARFSAAPESAASGQTLKDVAPPDTSVASTNEDLILASSTPTPAVQTPLPSSPPPPASSANMGIKQVQPALPDETASAQTPQSTPGILPPGIDASVKRPSLIPLSETMMLFKLVEEGKSEEAASTNTYLPNINPKPNTSFQALVALGLKALRKCMETDLRIDAGHLRTPALLNLVWNIHFAMAPEFDLPLQNTDAKRFLNSREVATVFLLRHGPTLWPEESQPAPHLIDRSLQFARDSSVDPSRYWEWMALGHPHPKKGSLTDLQISKLGIRMTKFIGLVYDLPVKRSGGVDWSVVALVLDDLEVGEETLGERGEMLPKELRRRVLSV